MRSDLSRVSIGTSRDKRSLDWVLPQQVAVGHFPEETDVDLFQQQGIKALLSLCHEEEGAWSDRIRDAFHCVCIALPDSHHDEPLEPEALGKAVETLQANLRTYGSVYVHCLAGMERSPTVCIAYLCRYHGLELWEALNWLKQVHPRSSPTSAQLLAIQNYLRVAKSLG
jgi:protein-tyrosine phosphatase